MIKKPSVKTRPIINCMWDEPFTVSFNEDDKK